jgi:hypothetical protein
MTLRPVRTRRAVIAATTATIVAALSVPVAVAAAPATPARVVPADRGAAPGELTVSTQDFALDVDDVFVVTIGLPPGFDTATLGADGSRSAIVISAHEEAATVGQVREALEGTLPRVDDIVQVSLALDEADERVVRTGATEVTVSVQTEAADTSDDALRLASAGVFPVSIALVVSGDTVAQVNTFVARAREEPADGSDADADDLAVGLVVGTTTPPTIVADGGVEPAPEELEELGRLADALAAVDAAAAELGTDAPPRAVLVEPSSLAVLPDLEPDLVERLVPLLESGEVLARPRLPFDPSSAIAAGREDLYTQLLREGEDALADALPSTRINRSVLFPIGPISADALSLRRDLGTQLVVLPYERYETLEGSIGRFADTSQLLAMETSDGTEMPAILIDPDFSDLLETDGDDVTQATAIALVAQLIAFSRQIDDVTGSVSRHGVVLARSDGGVPDARLLGLVTALLLESDGVRMVDPSDLASTVDTQIIDGSHLLVTPSASAGVDLRRRFDVIDDVSRDVLSTASMLPENEPLIASWTRVLGAVVSTALTDDEADEMVARLREQIDVYRNGVQGPEPYSFRFTGRSGSIKFKLRNLTDRPLTVRITMTSAKLEFRDADRPVDLAPLQETEVTMPFEALSNGTSSVFLRVFTLGPEPSDETQIVDDIILTARVTTLTGLGQLVTGAALLVLCTWWFRHWRQTRRRRLADAVAPRHPAAASSRAPVEGTPETVATIDDADAPVDDRAAVAVALDDRCRLAPDAAATTLPPS